MPSTIPLETWSTTLQASFKSLWSGVLMFLPNLIVALVIIIVGWVVAALVGRVISQVFRSLKVDEALKRAGVEDALAKGGIMLNSGHFVGGLVKWFVIAVFFVAAFQVLGLTDVNDFLQNVVISYLPRVIVAVLILLVGAVIGDVMQKIVTTSAKTAELHSARFLGTVTKWTIWIITVLAALSQLGIAAAFVQVLFTGFVVALSLALGLSFGLGGQEAAARFLEKTRQEISHKE